MDNPLKKDMAIKIRDVMMTFDAHKDKTDPLVLFEEMMCHEIKTLEIVLCNYKRQGLIVE
jgi:hypothetical protein